MGSKFTEFLYPLTLFTNILRELSDKSPKFRQRRLMDDQAHKNVKNQAQSMVEFALAIPIVLVMMVGIIEGGRLLFIYSSVATASREGARYGAGVGENGGGIDRYKDCAGIREAAKKIGFFAGVQDADITIHYDAGPGTATKYADCSNSVKVKLGDRIVVGVTVPYSPVVSLIPFPSFDISSSNTHTIIKAVPVIIDNP